MATYFSKLPYGLSSAAARGGNQLLQPRADRPYKLTEEEETTALQQLAKAGAGGLAYAHQTLNKPDRAFWGTASGLTGGKFGGGLLNLIPFSDTMGLTDPDEGIEASQFLKSKGLMDDDAHWGKTLAADIFLNPTTYLTLGGGALKPAGHVLNKAGVLKSLLPSAAKPLTTEAALMSGRTAPGRMLSQTQTSFKDVLGVANKRERGHIFEALKKQHPGMTLKEFREFEKGMIGGNIGFRAPFNVLGSKSSVAVTGAGKFGELAARGQDALWRGATQNVLSRSGQMLFNQRVGNHLGRAAQELSRRFQALAPGASHQAVENSAKLLKGIGEALTAVDDSIGKRMSEQTLGNLNFTANKGFSLGDVVEFSEKVGKRGVPEKGLKGLVKGFNEEGLVVHMADATEGGAWKVVPYEGEYGAKLLGEEGVPAMEARAMSLLDEVVQEIAGFAVDTKKGAGQFDVPAAADYVLKKYSTKDVPKLNEKAIKSIEKVAGLLEKNNEDIVSILIKKGVPVTRLGSNLLDDDELLDKAMKEALEELGIGYNPRFHDPKRLEIGRAREYKVKEGFTEGRNPVTQLVPKRAVIDMASDPNLRVVKGTTTNEGGEEIANVIAEKYGSVLRDDYVSKATGEIGKSAHAEDLAQWVNKTSTRFVAKDDFRRGLVGGMDFFGNKQITDQLSYQKKSWRLNATTDAIHLAFRDNPGLSTTGQRTLAEAFKSVGMNPDNAVKHFAKSLGITAEEAAERTVSTEAIDAANAVLKIGQDPDKFRTIVSLWDRYIRMFKSNVTLPFPAFHVRNVFSGTFVNMSSGLVESPADMRRYAIAFNDAWKMRTGDGDPAIIKEIFEHNVAPHGTTLEGVDTFIGKPEDVITGGSLPGRFRDIAGDLFGPNRGKGVIDRLVNSPVVNRMREARLNSTDPLDQSLTSTWLADRAARQRGAADVVDEFGKESAAEVLKKKAVRSEKAASFVEGTQLAGRTAMSVGGKVAQQAEWMNRVTMFTYLRKKGWSPAAAAEKVRELQLDYSALSQFEKTYAKRLVPFYSFTRLMGETLFKNLIERPGSMQRQAIRAADTTRDRSGTAPDYVAQTSAVNLNNVLGGSLVKGLPEGTDRYLIGLGLAHESPLQFIGSPSDIGAQLISSTAPPISKSLEGIFGVSSFHRTPMGGRPISEMDPPVGRMLSNLATQFTGRPLDSGPYRVWDKLEHAAQVLPVSRYVHATKQLFDPRKRPWTTGSPVGMLPLTTGLRIADISPESRLGQINRRLGGAIKDIPGARSLVRPYITPDVLAEQSPEERARSMQLLALLAANERRRKAINKAKFGAKK